MEETLQAVAAEPARNLAESQGRQSLCTRVAPPRNAGFESKGWARPDETAANQSTVAPVRPADPTDSTALLADNEVATLSWRHPLARSVTARVA